MISAVISIYLAEALYKLYFTNKTYYTAAALTLLSLFLFRGLFLLISFLIKVIREEKFLIMRYLQHFSMELITSTIASILLFFILQFFFKSLQTSDIKKRWFKKA